MRPHQYGLLKSPMAACLIVASMGIGVPRAGCLGCWLAFSAFKNWIKASVFAAAPLRFTRMGPEKEKLVSVNAPPEYCKVTSENLHPSQSRPSIACSEPLTLLLVMCGPSPGTTGSLSRLIPWCSGSRVCARTDVWVPETMSHDAKDPRINDPNASVTLDITPPLARVNITTAMVRTIG